MNKIYWFLLMLFILLVVFAISVSASASENADETFRPQASGSEFGLTASGATEDYDCVNEYPNTDENSTYLRNNQNNVNEESTFVIENFTAPHSTINSLSVTFNIMGYGNFVSTDCHAIIKISGTIYEIGSDVSVDKDKWQTYTKTLTTNPANGSNDWTWGDINITEIGIRLKSFFGDSSNHVRVSMVYATVNYDWINGSDVNYTNYLNIYKNAEWQGKYQKVGFGGDVEVNCTTFEVGDNHWRIEKEGLEEINFSKSTNNRCCYNISKYSNSRDDNTTFLEFNATYVKTGEANFAIDLNRSYYAIDMLVDDSVVVENIGENSGGWYNFSHTFSNTNEKYTFVIKGRKPNCPTNGVSVFNTMDGTLNLSWDAASYADSYVVVKKIGSYPANPTDGTTVSNDSVTYCNFSASSNEYYSVWSYYRNGVYSPNSCKLDIPWGSINIKLYNESNPSMEVEPFGILMTNATDSYQKTYEYTPHNISYSNIIYGNNVLMLFNATDYEDRLYTKDILENYYYNWTFYLPPFETEVDEGGGDPGGSGENYSTTEDYVLQVINELNNPVSNAEITINRYINTSGEFDEVGSVSTDGYGQADANLIVGVLYKFDITADGYIPLTGQSWQPKYIEFTEDRYKTFRLEFEEPSPPSNIESDIISFDAQRLNSNIYVNWSTTELDAINVTIIIYEINITYDTYTLFHTNTTNSYNTVNLHLTNANSSNDYVVYIFYNTTLYKNRVLSTVLNRDYEPPQPEPATGQTRLPDFLTTLIGHNPFGWGNFLIFIFLIMGMFYIDQKDSGIFVILLGGIFLFINIFFGFTTTLSTIAGGVIPTLFIVFGIIIMWNQRKWRDTSG